MDPSKINTKKGTLSQQIIDDYNNKDWGRSPFNSRFSSTEAKVNYNLQSISWNLSGIIFNTTTPLAIINKKPVTVGQIVDNAKVVAIEKDEVILKIDDKQIKLKVSKG